MLSSLLAFVGLSRLDVWFRFPREFHVLIRFFVSGVTWSVRVSSGLSVGRFKVQGSKFFIICHIHNHTSIISSEMQVELKKNTAFTWGKWGEKNNSQTMLLGEYSVRTGKTPQQHKSTYTTKPQGKWIRPSKQPSDPAATDPALVRPAWPGQRIEANRGEWLGGGGGGQCL